MIATDELGTHDILKQLSNAFGVAGFEDEVRARLGDLVRPHVDELQVDTLGNLIATRKGTGQTTLMLDAHMDEIGFMVSFIEENGFLRFTTIGSWDARIIPSHKMTIRTDSGERLSGIIGTAPPHILKAEDRKKVHEVEELFVDVGAPSAEEVRQRGIRIGSPAVIAYPFESLREPFMSGKALDDRAGCAVLVKTLQALRGESLSATVVANFATAEEVGLRGARTAAFQIEPDVALALEGTVGADVPGIPESSRPTVLGKGPAITVADRSLITNPRLVRALTETAEAEGIPYQYKIPPSGSTDAAAIQQSRGGVLAGVLSVPCRYIHSPFSVMRTDDLENAVRLTTAFAKRCAQLMEQERI